MTNEKFFKIFYDIPNPLLRSWFQAGGGGSEPHPLADLIEEARLRDGELADVESINEPREK
ncbi:MAG: hypothetical protein JOZ54_09365 [Acidobacteria bacterium]|nr:hypothetical protein [Acidobacteriota bacterium]